jgi:hypothetical protein
MRKDEAALVRLWREKRRGEPEDLSGNLIVQLGVVTEDLNRRWYEASDGSAIRLLYFALSWDVDTSFDATKS